MKKKLIVSIVIGLLLVSFNTIYATVVPVTKTIAGALALLAIMIWPLYIIFSIIYYKKSKKEKNHKETVLGVAFFNLLLLSILLFTLVKLVH